MSKEQLVLIDGHALAYRVFYALPLDAFTTRQGEPTNATFGFTRTLLDLIQGDEPPRYLAVSFDVGKTFRDDMFEEYKGTREKMPDELRQQIDRIKEVVETLNIPIYEVEGYEADDVLGTIAQEVKVHNVPVKIVTGDRDLLQLVDDGIYVELPPGRRQNQPQLYDVAAVEEKYGIRVEQFVDYKALIGDKSDNIPGVVGIGAKTAVKLLNEYASLEGIYEHVPEMKGALKRKLEEGRENAFLSQKLARIVTDVPLHFDLEACLAHDFDVDQALALFQELEFRSLTSRLLQEAGDEELEAEPTESRLVRSSEQLANLVKKLEQADVISFDVETTGLDKMSAELVGVSLAVREEEAYYIPVGHIRGSVQKTNGQMGLFAGAVQLADNQLSLKSVLDALRPVMANASIRKVAHNAKFDYTILQRHGLTVSPLSFDTMIAEWLIDPASRFLGLKDMARQRLGIEMTPIEELIGKGKDQKSFAETSVDEALPYAAADADVTLRLMAELEPELDKLNLKELFDTVEMPLIRVLSDMEQTGVGVSREFFQTMSEDLAEKLEQLETEIHAIAGQPFNINSTQQLSEILFRTLELPHEGIRKTRSGYFSTALDVLESVRPSDDTGIIDKVLTYRELTKLKSTYVDALPEMINEETGRIHTSFNQTGAVTGRIASSSPNLQNIPIRTEIGRKIRRGFVAKPGWMLLAADYSQVELRILAHISQDEALLEAFRNEQDIHRATAASVYGVSLEEVTFEQRRFAKAVNFGLIYGMGAYRLSRDSNLTLAEAEDFIKVYFDRFPGIQRYLDKTKELARAQGYVETLLGRRRYFPVFQVRGGANRQLVSRAEREAINHPIQGTAADIIKLAMIALHRALVESYEARMILQVHDELVLEAPEHELDEIRKLVVETMSHTYQLSIPLKVDTGTGRNWLEMKA